MPVVKPEPAWRPADEKTNSVPVSVSDLNRCNLHADCEAADRAVAAKGGRSVNTYYGVKVVYTATHCSTDDCEDCFGC